MKIVIAGSRSINNYQWLEEVMIYLISQKVIVCDEIVSGGCRGVDLLGERYAKANNIPIKQFLPDWVGSGKGAALIRNKEMAQYADVAVILWDGSSTGTAHMMKQMELLGKPTFMFKLN